MNGPTKDALDFATKWESAKSVDEVSRKVGLSKRTCSMKAGMYRSKYGVPLKRFKDKGREVQWNLVARKILEYRGKI